MMKKTAVSGICLAAMALSCMLTGCGRGTSNEKVSPTTVELFSSKAENKQILRNLADKFEESHENVTIQITAPADAGTVLKTRMAKNDMPDMIALGGDLNYTEVQSAGMLEDLSQEPFLADIQDVYLQMVYDVNQNREEKAYSIPYAVNASGVIYNTEIFRKLDLDEPDTWEDFLEVCEELKKAGEQPLLLPYKDAWTTMCAWNSMESDLWPTGFAEDRKAGNTTFAGTHEEIAEKYLRLLDYAQEDYMGMTYDDGNKAFASGKAAMIINGNWVINQCLKANPDLKVNMFAFPASEDDDRNYVTSGVDVLFGICKDSKVKDVAKEFLTFLLQPENARAYIEEQFAFSAVKGVQQRSESVEGVREDLQEGKVANFPDHYYPAGFSMAPLLSELCLNDVKGMDRQENIRQFLQKCDEKYDLANMR